MCCSAAKWKREEVQDHKFDFVDVDEFYDKSLLLRLKYFVVLMMVLKSLLVYIADIWTAGILLIFDRWSSTVQPAIPFFISKWIYVGCIFTSFFLLAWDIKKARHIIRSKDISYAFTNVIAYRHYTLKSYSHFCFFSKINNSKKKVDNIAFFVFFAFKGWKRLIFAEAPRQMISAITLYSILQSNTSKQYLNLNQYGTDIVQHLATGSMAFSLLIFTVSASMLILAFILYIPLLCQIRGNLKEYCCHKIDKRISELLKKNSKKRLRIRQLQAEAEAVGDFSHLKKKNKKVQMPAPTPRQPTLPNMENNSLLPSNSQSQKIVAPEPVTTNFPPHGQNATTQNYAPKNDAAGRQLYRADANNYLPYINKNTGPGYLQPPYTSKSPPPGVSQRGYNNLTSMKAAKSEPMPQIHAAISKPIPPVHGAYVAVSEPIPKAHMAVSEPIPKIRVEAPRPTSVTASQSTSRMQTPVIQPPEPVDIINNYRNYSDLRDFNNNYSDSNNYNDNYSNYSDNSYIDNNNSYINYNQPAIGVNRNPPNNFAPPKISNSQPHQQVDQLTHSNYTQQEHCEIIDDYYYYAQ